VLQINPPPRVAVAWRAKLDSFNDLPVYSMVLQRSGKIRSVSQHPHERESHKSRTLASRGCTRVHFLRDMVPMPTNREKNVSAAFAAPPCLQDCSSINVSETPGIIYLFHKRIALCARGQRGITEARAWSTGQAKARRALAAGAAKARISWALEAARTSSRAFPVISLPRIAIHANFI
jgi:hypothetical protein